MKIAIGSDHAGYELKEQLKNYLSSHQLTDVGCNSTDSIDYPDYANDAAQLVSLGKVDKGILICGSGIGMSIAANKVAGVRAALCCNPTLAQLSRQHNDANILCLGARFLSVEEAGKIVDVWLKTDFEGGRHQGRIDKITKIERDTK